MRYAYEADQHKAGNRYRVAIIDEKAPGTEEHIANAYGLTPDKAAQKAKMICAALNDADARKGGE